MNRMNNEHKVQCDFYIINIVMDYIIEREEKLNGSFDRPDYNVVMNIDNSKEIERLKSIDRTKLFCEFDTCYFEFFIYNENYRWFEKIKDLDLIRRIDRDIKLKSILE